MLSSAAWLAAGEQRLLSLPTGRYDVFVRDTGEQSLPWLTLIHGYPTSSWDFAPVMDALAGRYRMLTLDLLGYGASAKPTGHRYSLFEQADLVKALWREAGVTNTAVLAHDYGSTVAAELMARQLERPRSEWGAEIERVTLLNAGLFAALIKPTLGQWALIQPGLGALVARLNNRSAFGRQFASIFGPEHPVSALELDQHWALITRGDGGRSLHPLAQYQYERRDYAARWEGVLANPGVPVRYVWGLADPISGASMAQRLRAHVPGIDLVELPGVGHYPQLEVPTQVAAAVL